ncbi:MAG: serine hydrolase [Capsulimonadales bacterium]|nr:serine hydrolase [Capsulimonadales bacterium]
MRTLLFPLVLMLLFACAAQAETPFKVGAQNFDFADPKGTNSVAITIDSPLEPITGVASGIRGTARFDPDDPRATTGTISVDVSSLRFPNDGYTQTARSYGLEEDKHPAVTCVLKSIRSGKITRRTAETCLYEGMVDVDFTCKGVTRRLTVPLKVGFYRGIAAQRGPDFEGDVINVRCDFTIKRSDFGIAPEVAPILVTEEIGVRVSLVGVANRKVRKPAPPVKAESTDIPIKIDGKSYTLAERMKFHRVPGCVVAVIRGGNVTGIHPFGQASADRAVTGDTLFPAGSLSHPLTAAAVLRAADSGVVDLDRNIDLYLKTWKTPKSPLVKDTRGVTLRDLLTQRSGFTYHKYLGYDPAGMLPTLLQVLNGQSPAVTPPASIASEPGKTFNLAMENWTVLQQVAEDVSGQPFDTVMRDLLFQPLAMKESRFVVVPPASISERTAVGHDENGSPLTEKWRAYPEVAASGLWTTPNEFAGAMAELLRCLRGQGKYLTKETAQKLVEPVAKDSDGDEQAIGFGITERDGRKILFRGGNTTGYYCQMFADPEKGNACIVFTNRNLCWQLTNEIVDAVDWK